MQDGRGLPRAFLRLGTEAECVRETIDEVGRHS